MVKILKFSKINVQNFNYLKSDNINLLKINKQNENYRENKITER